MYAICPSGLVSIHPDELLFSLYFESTTEAFRWRFDKSRKVVLAKEVIF
jgi:hypothetical protein